MLVGIGAELQGRSALEQGAQAMDPRRSLRARARRPRRFQAVEREIRLLFLGEMQPQHGMQPVQQAMEDPHVVASGPSAERSSTVFAYLRMRRRIS